MQGVPKKNATKRQGSELVCAFRVLGEPALLDTFFLLEHFLDGPKGGEGEHTKQRREQDVVHANRCDYASYTQQQENPPAASTPIILGLDYYGMEKTNNQERAGFKS